jgi:flagellar protein FlaI
MDEIREKVRGFLTEFTSPDDKDVEGFVSNIAAGNPSLEIGLFRKNLIKFVKQAGEIAAYEKGLSFLEQDSPLYNELETALKKAKKGQQNLEDISEELKTVKRILESVKEAVGAEKLKDVEKIDESLRPQEPIEKEGEESSKKPKKDEKKTVKKRGKRKEERIEKGEHEGLEGLKHHFDADKTREIIKEGMTPEKHVKFEQLQEKLLSDVETGMRKLKEAPPERPVTLFQKVKIFLTKDAEEVETYDHAMHGPLVTFEGMAGYNEVERYWVNKPYAFVVMLLNPEKNSYLYYVAEPRLSDFEDLFLKEIKDRLKDVLFFEDIKSDEDKEKILTSKVRRIVKDYAIDTSPLTLEKILYYTRRDFIKFGKIDPLMHDNNIEDISSNGYDIPIYLYHKKYTNMPTNVYFIESELDSYVIRLAQRCGKHISIAEPMVDATMPDGSRIQMTLGTEVTTHGATFTIRKFSEVPITPVDLINWNTFSAEEMAYLWLCIENNKSLIFSGGTASGKTSSLNAVSIFIPWQAKIISLEDTRELKLPHPNWIPGVTRDSFTSDGKGTIDMYDLLRAALRQRPEYLLVGEVRGKEALTLFQAMSTGHTTFSTMHADSVSGAIHRLENPPISVPRSMIQALNIMSIQAQTYVNGKRARLNMKLVEITDIDPTTRNIRTNDIFVWDALTDKFQRVGESKALNDILVRRGWDIKDLKKELSNRQKILDFMVNNKITDFNAISTIVHDYQVTPDKVLRMLNISG